ncbi:MAG: cytochrome c biogenesis protein CcdA [Actinomycetaceae bacterium]|nr:cytochrome c biogenesis protein CcdA [Actinomycetaceae bacterium]
MSIVITGILSIIAGILTVFSPCVLPLLPIIVGGSIESPSDRRRPYVIAGSLIASLVLFTLLLKATAILIGVTPSFWKIASGLLVIGLGLTMLFPDLWSRLTAQTPLNTGSHSLLESAQRRSDSHLSAVLTGAALGPVFNSCSPTYAWVVATVLPSRPMVGMLYLALYCVGLATMLLAISLAGRKLIDRLGWAANPRGWFQRTIAVIFIIVGLLVSTGVSQRVEAWLVDWAPSLTDIERQLVPDTNEVDDPYATALGTPELRGIDHWINSEPLTLDKLKGQVVLVDFWTYSCINCIRTQPYLNSWYDTYHDQGLEIVGVHAPEFAFEKLPENVERAVKEAEIRYPVALDNKFATWNSFRNQYWPAKYLIDRDGNVVYSHFGEGNYDEIEAKIRELLDASGPQAAQPTATEQPSLGQSPETYLGYRRAYGYTGDTPFEPGVATFTPNNSLAANGWTLGGTWEVDEEKITAKSNGATLSYRFSGQQVFLVLGGPEGARVRVSVDGVEQPGGLDIVDGQLTIDSYRLYRLVRLPQFSDDSVITLEFDEGVAAHAFTFG